MTFAWPYAFFMLPFWYLSRRRRSAAPSPAVPHPCVAALKTISPGWRVKAREPVLRGLGALLIGLLTVASARPQRIMPDPAETQGREIVLALDSSGSMGTRDFKIGYRAASRLEAVKRVVADFVEGRPQDRIGLVVFGSQAYLACPLTRDHELLRELLAGLQVGIAGDRTALGDGLALGLQRVHAVGGRAQAVILLTDGVNTAGRIDPLQAAALARDLRIKVHTIGVGSPHSRSQRIQEGYDEPMLQAISEASGGVYFNAADSRALGAVYREIDRLERSKEQGPRRTIAAELYAPFAAAAFLVLALHLLLSSTVFLKVP